MTRIARVDLERVGASSLIVRTWNEGYSAWDAGQADNEDFLDTGSIQDILAGYEKQGFVVWMASAGQGRALRGVTTRVDIILTGESWVMKKYPYGWSAKTPAIETKHFNQVEADAAIQWLKQNKWTVLEWPGGFRAFKGKPMPVRDKYAIMSLRRKYEQERINFNYDLAFYF